MNTTVNNIRIFKTQEAATHTVLTIFYMFWEIPRTNSVSSKDRSSTLWSSAQIFSLEFSENTQNSVFPKTDRLCMFKVNYLKFNLLLP